MVSGMTFKDNRPEYTKPEGCQATAVTYGYSFKSEEQNLTIVCGNRRAELNGVSPMDDKVVLATEMILGFCVGCPNKLAQDSGAEE